MSDEKKQIKVTDKRPFTADGELREEFSYLEDSAGDSVPEPTPAPPNDEPAPETVQTDAEFAGAPDPVSQPAAPPAPEEPAPVPSRPDASEPPTAAGGLPPQPGFMDLLVTLAQQASLYLGEIELPDGTKPEDLGVARLYIDFLDVLRQKTTGNLTAEESAALDGLLSELRFRYVEKSG